MNARKGNVHGHGEVGIIRASMKDFALLVIRKVQPVISWAWDLFCNPRKKQYVPEGISERAGPLQEVS